MLWRHGDVCYLGYPRELTELMHPHTCEGGEAMGGFTEKDVNRAAVEVMASLKALDVQTEGFSG
jgi:hypothetical protein